MPSLSDLGAKVKAKYPGQYDDFSDADLGAKVKAKYPGAYDDFTDIPQGHQNVIGGRTWVIPDSDQSSIANFGRWLQSRVDRLEQAFQRFGQPGIDPKLGAASDVIRNVGEAALPLAAPAALSTPVRTATSMALGAAGAGLGELLGHFSDLGPGAAEALETAGGLGGGVLGERAGGAVSDLVSRIWANPAARSAVIQAIPGNSHVARAVKAVQAVKAAAAVPDEDAATLEALAKDWFTKSFENLTPEQQSNVRNLASRFDKPVPPELAQPPERGPYQPSGRSYLPPEPQPTEDELFLDQYRRAVSAPPEDTGGLLPNERVPGEFLNQYNRAIQMQFEKEEGRRPAWNEPLLPEGTPPSETPSPIPLRPPVNPPVPEIPIPQAGGGGPLRPPLAGAPPPAEPPSIAQQLFESMKQSGEIPPETKPGQPIGGEPSSSEPFKAAARAARATTAQSFADTFHAHDIPSGYLDAIEPGQWKQVADAVGLDWPASKAAQTKLIRETMKALKLKEGGTTSIGDLMK